MQKIQDEKMKGLTVDAHKRNRPAHPKNDYGKNKKIGKSQEFIENKNGKCGYEHNDKLPGGNRSDNLVLHINELRDGKLLHNRVTCNL